LAVCQGRRCAGARCQFSCGNERARRGRQRNRLAHVAPGHRGLPWHEHRDDLARTDIPAEVLHHKGVEPAHRGPRFASAIQAGCIDNCLSASSYADARCSWEQCSPSTCSSLGRARTSAQSKSHPCPRGHWCRETFHGPRRGDGRAHQRCAAPQSSRYLRLRMVVHCGHGQVIRWQGRRRGCVAPSRPTETIGWRTST
jgi:hypothetical protein